MKEDGQGMSDISVKNRSLAANESRTAVTVIGLGMMGSALAETLLKEGHPTTVWNRTAGKADALALQGAAVAATTAEAIAASPMLIVCVLDYNAMHEILEPAGHMLIGKTLVNLTNGTPAQARKAAAWAANQGADYIDGGIMAIPQMIGSPGALVLYSGSPDAFMSCRLTLEKLGRSNYLGEDAGLAPLYDLALLSAMYGMFGGFFQAAAMVRSEMIQAAALASLVVPWLHAMSAALPRMAQAIDSNDHATDVSSLHKSSRIREFHGCMP
ncbi:NAD(P)-binding domain-containing protein [Paenibacillus piri]|uniref:NAD(P)-binding domain-containing protein n=1 Tax=Paenibacillus piri TaxID=2547395 RepID=UPI001FE59984|nr:NAD(P)-binding domain-containing protein [Paenibacillus piri]